MKSKITKNTQKNSLENWPINLIWEKKNSLKNNLRWNRGSIVKM